MLENGWAGGCGMAAAAKFGKFVPKGCAFA
jgi:hypothetical protein